MKKEKEFMPEYLDYIKQDQNKDRNEQELLAYLLIAFIDLWYNPNEPLDEFRKWFAIRMQRYNINGLQLEYAIDNFYDYWSESDKKIKNFKTTFFNWPLIRKYLKHWYEINTI